ncbi:PREDICTED: uncharacterized protein LOC104601031 [Nelumbo nucifera]|uniref:C2 domain-containing protein n=2 Tax=Nelumbo nucifera TaxID=4432 RepID=A0A822YW20_NELNU|nr:PREDICTED: uncharacterized protein LOC104601031 [Nelumbo nucifera]DAD36882.1 TPA_asm: hypothetical protein HUJ06_007523 [Nelumbo nucifera]
MSLANPVHPLVPSLHLEINVISALDLAPVTSAMRTYAVACLDRERKCKQSTRIALIGHTNPTWNAKFIFPVDEDFLKSYTSSVIIEIYALRYLFRNVLVGTVHVLVSNFIHPSSLQPHDRDYGQLVCLQVRRPSDRPQGLLNISVALLDNSVRIMPLCNQPSTTTVGYSDLMGKKMHTPHHRSYTPKKVQPRSSKSKRSVESDKDDLSSGWSGSTTITNSSHLKSDTGRTYSTFTSTEAAITEDYFAEEEIGSSVLERWSVDEENDEGTKHARRHTDGRGVFSCFGGSFGCQCNVYCGARPNEEKRVSRRAHLNPSDS